MNTRIVELRKYIGITQEAFASQIGLTRSAIANIENGKRTITDRVASDICREFNVNSDWLHTGRGEMFNSIDPDAELAHLMGKILSSKNDFIKHTMLTLARLDEDEWDFIENLIKKIKDGTN